MPGRHTAKQKRMAKHIIAGYKGKKGMSKKTKTSIAWATVNKLKGKKKK